MRRSLKNRKRKRVDEEVVQEPAAVEDATVEEEEGAAREEEESPAAGLPAQLASINGSGGKKQPGVIFVLEKASLEVGKVGKRYQILNSDDHGNYLKSKKRNPANYRPDIIHQALLAIFDSPLTKAKRLQAVYVRTEKGVLFEIKPNVRIPRTFKRFCGLMSQLLQNLSITAEEEQENLLKVIKNPVTRYLPVDSRKIGLSHSSQKSIDLVKYVAAAPSETTLVFVVGAMADGKIDQDYTDDYVKISRYRLSAACCLNQICSALQQKWGIH